MYQFKGLEDTIVAISTAAGQGGIGIVRISGKESVSIAEKIFKAKLNKDVKNLRSFSVCYGWIVDQDKEIIDEVLLTKMQAPKSYTTEDVIEISCHGGAVSLQRILSLILDCGARLAEPGEFTKRAFLNGRIDLAQAEAVLDIINSKTDAFLKVSTHQLKGELSSELKVIRELLMNVYIEIEAIINFPEDEVEGSTYKQLSTKLKKALEKINNLLASSEHGRILKDGIKIVLCGKPNVGKSSLLNILLKVDRAIVSSVAGTTRDSIEETAQIKGIPFQLIDTAGILEPRDLIEEEAIKRSHLNIESADLILLVLDASQTLSKDDQDLIKQVKDQNTVVLLNKSDLNSQVDLQEIRKTFSDEKVLNISALTKSGINQLEQAIVENVWHSHTVDTHGVLISNLRHIDALKKALGALTNSVKIVEQQVSLEFASEEIKNAVNQLDSITGKNIDQDLLENIFSKFCIGK